MRKLLPLFLALLLLLAACGAPQELTEEELETARQEVMGYGSQYPLSAYGVTVSACEIRKGTQITNGAQSYTVEIQLANTEPLTVLQRFELIRCLVEEEPLQPIDTPTAYGVLRWNGDDGLLRIDSAGSLYTFYEGETKWFEDIAEEDIEHAAGIMEQLNHPEEEPEPEPEPTPTPSDDWSDYLSGINLSRAEIRQVYDELDAKINGPENPAAGPNPDWDEVDVWEDAAVAEIAEAHGITPEEADLIFFAGIDGALYSDGATDLAVPYGAVLGTTINGTTLIVKAKIEASLTDKMTIDQNYYNVCDIIHNQGGDQFAEIQYWAVADMADGSESKAISFDLDSNLIQTISENPDYPANTLGDKVLNLWVLPSLQE